MNDKALVHEFWNKASCGEALYLDGSNAAGYVRQLQTRYRLEPYIRDFARFYDWTGKDVLEIGVGLGADHQSFAEAGARLCGIDLTERAIEHALARFDLLGLHSDFRVADAEALPYADNTFDLVYSWGVLHHTPDTPTAIAEVRRVLRPGGSAKIMIYHKHSLVGYMLWLRYGLLSGRPLRPLSDIYANHLESPGTKAYTVDEARTLFRQYAEVRISTVLTHGDLLESEVGQRHRGWLLSMAKRIWPRRLLRLVLPGHGLFMLIEARK